MSAKLGTAGRFQSQKRVGFWARDVSTGFQGVPVAVRRIAGDCQISPIPIGMKRIEPHGLANQLNALLRATNDRQGCAHVLDAICIVWIKSNAAFEVEQSWLVLTAEHLGPGKKLVTTGVIRIQTNRSLRALDRSISDRIWGISHAMFAEKRQSQISVC